MPSYSIRTNTGHLHYSIYAIMTNIASTYVLLSANLGGQMGLFLGASILTLGEVAEFIVLTACMAYKRLRFKMKCTKTIRH